MPPLEPTPRRSRSRSRSRPRAAVALLFFVAVAGGAIGWVLLREESPPQLNGAPPARPASDFVDSVGVNIHLTYYDTAYGRFDDWVPKLRELGVRHVRDALIVGDDLYVERLSALGDAGWRASLITATTEGPAAGSVGLAAGPVRSAVETLENPNEPDLAGDDAWEGPLREFTPALRRAADEQLSDSVRILAPSFVDSASRDRVEDLSASWDLQNIHPYPGGEQPLPPEDFPSAPLMATETGYHNAVSAEEGQPPVSEEAAGAYMPRLLAENFGAGIERTYLYELLDEKPDPGLTDPEQHFGLLRQDLTPKPAFTAIRNLLRTISQSPGEGPHRDVSTKGGGAGELQRLLLDRPDGSRVLLLWRRLPLWDTGARQPIEQEPVPVRVRFADEASDIEVSYPSRSAQPAGRPDSSGITALVGGDLVVVSYR